MMAAVFLQPSTPDAKQKRPRELRGRFRTYGPRRWPWRLVDDLPIAVGLAATGAIGALLLAAVKSPHTAGKYVETCLRHGLIVEADNPDDARSKLLTLAPNMRGRLDAFFDRAITEVRLANREVDIKGPSPEEP